MKTHFVPQQCVTHPRTLKQQCVIRCRFEIVHAPDFGANGAGDRACVHRRADQCVFQNHKALHHANTNSHLDSYTITIT